MLYAVAGALIALQADSGGSIRGKAVLSGQAPRAKIIAVSPECPHEEKLRSEQVVVKEAQGENRLQWVAVYISSKIEGKFEPPREAILIDQRECRFAPHLAIAMVNQAVTFRNSDPTCHNVHGEPKVNREFNFSLSKAGTEKTLNFPSAEAAFGVRCDLHTWMGLHLLIVDHPFFAATGEDGTYEIRGLPAGEHELTFWHEKYGERKVKVKVAEGKASTQDITFDQN